MYVPSISYETLVAYLCGFDYAMHVCGMNSELKPFADWLDLRVGYHCSKHWPAVIRDVFANGESSLAMERFFELFREYKSSISK
jgi:hypothetical protein